MGELSVTGKFRGYEFEIIRFDKLEEWKALTGVDDILKNADDTIDIYYLRDAHMEDMTYTEAHFVYVDPSNRFLIITQCDDYEVIDSYFGGN